jgi:hypothetical protein
MESFATWVIAFFLIGFIIVAFIATAVMGYFREEGFFFTPINSVTK